jgi:Kef-type K+ transport system membrane component KefB
MLSTTAYVIHEFISNVPSELVVMVEIGVMIIIATVFAFLIKLFKQPLIPAYIFTGILIGPLFLKLIENQHLILSLSEIGVAFLIFTAGLEIKFKKLKEVGTAASIGGTLQIVLLFLIGFLVAMGLGFLGKAPVYIGLVVAFSSTMVVFKLLADKRELNSLHGRIIIGILLVQDIAAIIALTILSSDLSFISISIALAKALGFAVFAVLLAKVINPVFRKAAKTPELLLLVAISLLFLFSIGAFMASLSLIIGAFFAGVALANSDYKTEIEGRITPLRDFFAVIFFVALGMQLQLISKQFTILLLTLLAVVIIFKPLIIMFLVRIFGYKKRTSFLTGNALAQTSEFSLIIVTLGLGLGHITQGLFSTLVLLTIITMSLTTYWINYEKRFANWFSWPLNIFNKLKSKKENLEYSGKDGKKIILFGCHRMGSLFLKEFEKRKDDLIVVDYNPEIIKSLIDKKVPCIYGDFMNSEVIEKTGLKSAEIIISTIADEEDNLYLIKKAKKLNPEVLIFVVARRISEALKLYESGADYVIIPQIIGGQMGFHIIEQIKKDKGLIKDYRKKHKKYLESIHKILY